MSENLNLVAPFAGRALFQIAFVVPDLDKAPRDQTIADLGLAE